MHKRYSVAEAKNQLPAVIHEVERGDPVEITRHGKAVAIVISLAEYTRLRNPRPDLWSAYLAWRSRSGGGLPDDVVDGLADPSRDHAPTDGVTW